MRILIDTNIWIYLYIVGLEWVIEGIIKAGHEVWITDGVTRELMVKMHDNAYAGTVRMIRDGTVTVVDVPEQDSARPPIHEKAEDELIAVAARDSSALGIYMLITNDDSAIKRGQRAGIISAGILGFFGWCHLHGILSLDGAARGYDGLVDNGMKFKTPRARFLQDLANRTG
ncbi:MAG: hypothetical protein MPI95_05825 [Nitrosopumilus sp.]|nr:hypothetical protein [Nitrosopumilus sp.]MDA7958588.1 hypothetical protein [Nitrosopumilus sp.]